MEQNSADLIYLLTAAVNGLAPDPQRLKTMDMGAIADMADRQMLSAAAAYALESAGAKDSRLFRDRDMAIRKTMILDAERARVLAALEAAGIWYMPLKGVILKDFYPQFGMRQMSDNDILFDGSRTDDLAEIMQRLGFTPASAEKNHHVKFYKPPVSNFEMHTQLIGEADEPDLARYYRNVKERLIKDPDNAFGWHFSPEDFYVYLIAHEFKHSRRSGTGLRSLLDVYVFLRREGAGLDRAYIARELQKCGTEDFEEQSRGLAQKLFAAFDPALTEEEEERLGFFLASGAFGTKDQRVLRGVERKGKTRYIMGRIFLPMEKVKAFFPFFYRHRLLLPFLPLYRVLRRGNRAKSEIRTLMKRDP